MRLSNKAHPTEYNIHGRKLVGHNGELNANNQKELIAAISHLVKAMSDGQVMNSSETAVLTAPDRNKNLAKLAAIAETYHDKTQNGSWQALGVAIAATLTEYANREGFMRRILERAEVVQGGVPRIRVQQRSSRAVVATGPAQVAPTWVRDRYIMPSEFEIQTQILISEIDMNQTNSDLLEEKLIEGQEAIMVREDRLWKAAAEALLGVRNVETSIIGTLSPANLAPLRETLLTNSMNAVRLLIAADLWTDISTGTNFQNVYDPVSQYELIQTGYLGRIYGMEFLTDGYRVPQLQVLQRGEMFVLPESNFHGAYTDRGPVTANELNSAQNGRGEMSRGWHLGEILSMTVHNPASVVKATRR